MYTLAEKNEIIKLFKKGESVDSIHLHSNVPKSTIYEWKEQFEDLKEKKNKVNKLLSQGKLQEAENLAKEILNIDPESTLARSQLIAIYKSQVDKYPERIEEIERLALEILALEPENLKARSQLISIYKPQGRIKDVEQLAKEILEIDPENLPSRSQLIDIYKPQGRMEEVEQLAKEILALEPKSIPARSQLIAIYKNQVDKYPERIEEIERLAKEILELDAENLPARSQLISIYKQQGKEDVVAKLEKELKELKQRQNQHKVRQQQSKKQAQKQVKKKSKNQTQTENKTLNKNLAIQIKEFREKIHKGITTLENLSEYEEEISTLPDLYQKLLLAEAYTKFNIPTKAIQLLKEARKCQRYK